MRLVIGVCCVVLFQTLMASAALADAASHPCQHFPTGPLPALYGTDRYGPGPEANINQITFEATLPAPETLTHAERYMIAGLTRQPRGGGKMQSWHAELFTLLHPYLLDGNPVPERLSDDVFTYVLGKVTPDNWMPSFLKSPIHGEYPRLTAREFSAGDAYVQVLTPDELTHMAQFIGNLRDALSPDGKLKLIGPVVYLRIYGHHGVIENRLSFIMVPRG